MRLQTKLDSGDFLIMAEMLPPKGVDVSSMLADAERVKGRVAAFVVPEMSNAVMKMSSLGGALLLKNRGLESVVQVCCRDRNRLALQGDLLAAGALGISAVMAVNGEDISHGDHHTARSVEDVSLMELLKGIQGLQQGRDMAGVELAGAPVFTVGSTLTASGDGGASPAQLERLDQLSEAGVKFFVTQPVFDMQQFAGFMKSLGDRDVKIIPTVLLLKSLGMARYIDRNLEHVNIPAYILRLIQKSPDRVHDCVKIAGDTVRSLRDEGAAGVLISTIGWEDKLPQILDRIK
jgi:5,10-methylenetetrahydrofolate reductase